MLLYNAVQMHPKRCCSKMGLIGKAVRGEISCFNDANDMASCGPVALRAGLCIQNNPTYPCMLIAQAITAPLVISFFLREDMCLSSRLPSQVTKTRELGWQQTPSL